MKHKLTLIFSSLFFAFGVNLVVAQTRLPEQTTPSALFLADVSGKVNPIMVIAEDDSDAASAADVSDTQAADDFGAAINNDDPDAASATDDQGEPAAINE